MYELRVQNAEIEHAPINTDGVLIDHAFMGRSRLPEDLIAQLRAAVGGARGTISDMEDMLEDLKALIGQQGIDQELNELPPEDSKPKPCPRCGKLVRVHTKNVPRTFESLSGRHTLARNYHHCGDCRAGFCPRDAELGLPAEGDATLKLESRLLDFAVTGPYERNAQRWAVHYPHRKFSATMFRLVAERVGRRLQMASPRVLQEQLARAPSGKRELLYVLNDGGMLPGLAGWKEAKVGVLVRGENYTAHRPTRRGHVSEARYVAAWGEQEEFKELMRAALDAERWQRFETIVWLGDGAKGNWTLAETLCPTAIQILDPIHAIENGVDCGRALLGEGSVLLEDWKNRIEQLVYAGDVNALIRELMECWLSDDDMSQLCDEQLTAIDKLIGYYRNNEGRMRYREYLADGLMIGSGIVEAAHRHVLQERMKLSGQHWAEQSGRRMVSMRAAYQTAGPDRFHHAINRATCVTYLAQVRRRRADEQKRDAAPSQAALERHAA